MVLNARDAAERGARIMPRTKVTRAERTGDLWEVEAGGTLYRARMLVNAGGPWVSEIASGVIGDNKAASIRLVRGSHIVVPRLYDHEKCYFFQGPAGRIIFAIPYEQDYTLIGTTDAEHDDLSEKPACSDEEADYLCAFASRYFKVPITRGDVAWTYSGVRPLFDDGSSSATAATRDYKVVRDAGQGAPLVSIYGGKITTYRKLAESALAKLGLDGAWTAGAPLPGGDFPADDVAGAMAGLGAAYPFIDDKTLRRLFRTYGTELREIFGAATSWDDLGQNFGAGITAAELEWAVTREWVRTGEDFLWRRTKLGLALDAAGRAAVDDHIRELVAQP